MLYKEEVDLNVNLFSMRSIEALPLALSSGDSVLKTPASTSSTPGGDVGVEKVVDFLQTFAGCLRVCEEDVYSHGSAKGSKDHVRLPLDVGEGRRHKEGECKIKRPVGGRGQTDTSRTVLEREDFGSIDPADRSPGETVNTNKDVR